MLPPRMQARCDQSQCSHHHNLCRMNVISSGRVQSPLLCRDASLVSSSRSCLRDRPGSSRKGSTSQQCTDTPNPTVHIMLAGALVLNSLAVPWILSPAAAAKDSRALTPSAAAASGAGTRQPSRRPIYAVADAPNVHAADPESAEQQMPWWQQDQQVDSSRDQSRTQSLVNSMPPPAHCHELPTVARLLLLLLSRTQVWLELTSASELTAYLSSSQPPPAWPALESTALNPRLRLVEFYATWCPACKAAAPGMAEVAGGWRLEGKIGGRGAETVCCMHAHSCGAVHCMRPLIHVVHLAACLLCTPPDAAWTCCCVMLCVWCSLNTSSVHFWDRVVLCCYAR